MDRPTVTSVLDLPKGVAIVVISLGLFVFIGSMAFATFSALGESFPGTPGWISILFSVVWPIVAMLAICAGGALYQNEPTRPIAKKLMKVTELVIALAIVAGLLIKLLQAISVIM